MKSSSNFRDKQKIARSEEHLSVLRIVIIGGMHLLALFGLFHFSVKGLAVLTIGHFLTGCLGITIGFHRLLSHRSFSARLWFMYATSLLGTLALQGGPLTWAALHRGHHAHTDELGDAHSSKRGYLWSHLCWLFYSRPNGFRFSRKNKFIEDLKKIKWLRFLESNYLSVNFAAFLLFLLFFNDINIVLWAFPVRIVFYWHCTWLVNSYAHSDRRNPDGRILTAKNSAFVSALTYGEGWHRNHHVYPTSPKFQIEWYQLDFAYWLLVICEKLTLVSLKRSNSLIFEG